MIIRHSLRRISLFSRLVILLCIVVLSVSFFLQSLPADAQGGFVQVWGQSGTGPSPQYTGIQMTMTTPDPAVSSGQAVGGPNGVTDGGNYFIESGPTKQSIGRRPYGNWDYDGGATHMFVDTSINLAAGGYYKYYSQVVSGTNWEAMFCYGSNPEVCRSQSGGTQNLHTSWLPYIASGGESTGPHWGSISTGNGAAMKLLGSSTWQNWCYGYPHKVNASGPPPGTISACSAPTYSWTSTY